ncbi:unnamed protein product, partial [Pylaiella littoralis]
DVDQALADYINDQRKQHCGYGNAEVMNKLLEMKPDALGGLPANATAEEGLAYKVKFNNWYQRFRKRHRFSIRRRTSVGQKLPKGHEGMAWATLMKLREALVFEELGNMDQTPVQHEMPAETTLQQRGDKDARIATGGESELRCCELCTRSTYMFPCSYQVLASSLLQFGHPMGGMSFGVQEKSWCDLRECKLWIKESWRVRPNNGSVLKQRACILVLDDFKCHKDDEFIAFLKRDTNTIVIFIPGGLTPLLQPLDRMLNKQMKRLLRGMYTKHSASAARDPKTGKLTPPGRGAVSTWCKDAWATITPEMVKTCFKICGLSLALDGSEDHAWCTHNFGEGYRELLEQQHAEWLAEHPGVTLPPLQLPEVPAAPSANHIEAAAKELETKLLPPGDDSDVEIMDDDSDVEIVDGAGGEAEVEVVEL